MPKRYILPDLPWVILLDIIVRDAPPGSVIEVHTAAMREATDRAVQQAGRDDLIVVGPEPHLQGAA
jgi:hypothetical protein